MPEHIARTQVSTLPEHVALTQEYALVGSNAGMPEHIALTQVSLLQEHIALTQEYVGWFERWNAGTYCPNAGMRGWVRMSV